MYNKDLTKKQFSQKYEIFQFFILLRFHTIPHFFALKKQILSDNVEFNEITNHSV